MFGGRFSSSAGLVGVDIGSRAIKLLQLRERHGQLEVVGAAVEHLTKDEARNELDNEESGASDADSDDQPQPINRPLPDSLAQRLRRTFSSSGFTGRRCVVSLPRSVVRVQAIRLPKMPDAELQQAAAWEAAQRFGMSRTECEVRALATGPILQRPSGNNANPGTIGSGKAGNLESGVESQGREEVLVIAAAHDAIEQHLRPILDAGLRPVAVDTDFAAIARYFTRTTRRESDRGVVRAILDVGNAGSTLMILRGDQIAFCKPLGLGGCRFNNAVAEQLQIEASAAAELRMARIRNAEREGERSDQPTTEHSKSTDHAVFDAVRPVMDDAVKEITLCLRYFNVTFRGTGPQNLILTGGDGLEPGLRELVERNCRIPVTFDEDGELGRIHSQIERTLSRRAGPFGCWATAAGLSIRNMVRRTRRELRTDRLEQQTEAAA